jgi:hypothetical protein
MSLMALILIVGAPALVSVIDDSAQSDHMLTMGSYTEVPDVSLGLSWKVDTPAEADKTFSFFAASENDGTNIFVLNALTSKAYFDRINTGIFVDSSDFAAGVSKIILHFDGDVTAIRLVPIGDNLPYSHASFKQIDDTNTWVLDIDQVMLAKLKANDANGSIQIYVGEDFDGTLSWTSETYAYTTIPYGEIIVGATGVLLIVCAILATPWVGTTGLTVKRRRSA